MSYEKLGFESGQKLKAEHLNHMEEGIANACGSSEAVLYTEQNLTEEQKAQARENIGAEKLSAIDDFIANTDIAHLYDEATNAYYTVIRVYKQKIDGTYQYPFVYAPNGAGSGNKSTYDMTTEDGWLLAINSGVFNTSTRKPDGIVIQDGVVIQNTPTATHSQCKPLTIDKNGNLGYAEYNADANQLVENGIVSAVCGFIPIVIDYNAVTQSEWNSVGHYTENAQRQIIGQWGNGDYAIITCEGRGHHNSDGWTIAEAQTICRKHGLKFAYNLDGGGSTETMLGLKPVNTIYENTTGRIVPTFIVFNGTTTLPDAVTPEPEPEISNDVKKGGIIYVNGVMSLETNNENRAVFVPISRYLKKGKIYKFNLGNVADKYLYGIQVYTVESAGLTFPYVPDTSTSYSGVTARIWDAGWTNLPTVYTPDSDNCTLNVIFKRNDGSGMTTSDHAEILENFVFEETEASECASTAAFFMHRSIGILGDKSASISASPQEGRIAVYSAKTYERRLALHNGEYWDMSPYSPIKVPAGAVSVHLDVPDTMRYGVQICENHPTNDTFVVVTLDTGSITDGRSVDVSEYNDGTFWFVASIAYKSNENFAADFDTSVFDIYFVDADGNRMT